MSDKKWRSIVSADDKGFPATTAELCREFLEERPKHIGAWAVYGGALLALGRIDDAHRVVDKTISLLRKTGREEFLPWQFSRKGHLYRDSGDFRSAIRAYFRAHKLDPNEATFLIFAGLLQFRLGELKKATATLESATECKEGATDEAFYNLGVVSLAIGDYPKAKACFERALQIDPKYRNPKTALRDVKSVLKNR